MKLKTVMILILEEMRENQFGVCDDLARCEWNLVTALMSWLFISCHMDLLTCEIVTPGFELVRN
jgi:hypothetical protein